MLHYHNSHEPLEGRGVFPALQSYLVSLDIPSFCAKILGRPFSLFFRLCVLLRVAKWGGSNLTLKRHLKTTGAAEKEKNNFRTYCKLHLNFSGWFFFLFLLASRFHVKPQKGGTNFKLSASSWRQHSTPHPHPRFCSEAETEQDH